MAEPNFPTSALYVADNLDLMRGMDSETVDLIATDPPFNKSVVAFRARDGTAADGQSFTDKWSWQDDVHPEWVDAIREDWPAVEAVINAARLAQGSDTAAYLCYMAVRLIEMRRILKPTGSLYLHCDHTAGAWLKALLDAIFERGNSRNEVIWKRTGSHGGAKGWGPIHDTILFYTKSTGYTWNQVHQDYEQEYIDAFYRYEDNRGRYRLVTLTGAGVSAGNSGKEWRGINPSDSGRHWAVPRSALQNAYSDRSDLAALSPQDCLDLLDAAGLIYWPVAGRIPQQKRYLHESPGVPIQDMVTDIRPLGSHANERTGWATQKPVALYERIVLASSNPGDIVFDPFAGCSTTLVAAEKHGRRWVGCDIDPTAEGVVRNRLMDSRQVTNTAGDVLITRDLPTRTDSAPGPAPGLVLKPRQPRERHYARSELLELLLVRDGSVCQGCGFVPPRADYLEIDHKQPRSEGGGNAPDNRVLLCSPCNRAKSDRLTLTGLRAANNKSGHIIRKVW